MNKPFKPMFFTFLILLGALALSAFVLGSATGSFKELFNALFFPSASDAYSIILWKLRAPRILAAIIVGAGLSSSGCALQSILRNPLAEPYTLGISSGASFGITLATVLGLTSINVFFLPAFSFAGTLLCIFAVYFITLRFSFSSFSLLLSGVMFGLIFSSLSMLLIALSDPNKMSAAILWLFGDLSNVNISMLWISCALILPLTIFLWTRSKELNALSLGEEKAHYLGVNVKRSKQIIFIVCALLTGVCVALCGVIGFVGLIVPNLLRLFLGSDNRVLLPASTILGGAFLLLCDTFARTVARPLELPVGVLTGVVGGAFFLLLLIKTSETEK
ncbi:MAG: iron ABC transporter permease [Endomicrobiales bacterium]|nr:iron ABC transporter permease [Endomicrobiales bacterium]